MEVGGADCEDGPVCEDEPEGLIKGIQIKELSKVKNITCIR